MMNSKITRKFFPLIKLSQVITTRIGTQTGNEEAFTLGDSGFDTAQAAIDFGLSWAENLLETGTIAPNPYDSTATIDVSAVVRISRTFEFTQAEIDAHLEKVFGGVK